MLNPEFIGTIQDQAVMTKLLLALGLVLEQVISARFLVHDAAGTRLFETFLGAGITFELHR